MLGCDSSLTNCVSYIGDSYVCNNTLQSNNRGSYVCNCAAQVSNAPNSDGTFTFSGGNVPASAGCGLPAVAASVASSSSSSSDSSTSSTSTGSQSISSASASSRYVLSRQSVACITLSHGDAWLTQALCSSKPLFDNRQLGFGSGLVCVCSSPVDQSPSTFRLGRGSLIPEHPFGTVAVVRPGLRRNSIRSQPLGISIRLCSAIV